MHSAATVKKRVDIADLPILLDDNLQPDKNFHVDSEVVDKFLVRLHDDCGPA